MQKRKLVESKAANFKQGGYQTYTYKLHRNIKCQLNYISMLACLYVFTLLAIYDIRMYSILSSVNNNLSVLLRVGLYRDTYVYCDKSNSNINELKAA